MSCVYWTGPKHRIVGLARAWHNPHCSWARPARHDKPYRVLVETPTCTVSCPARPSMGHGTAAHPARRRGAADVEKEAVDIEEEEEAKRRPAPRRRRRSSRLAPRRRNRPGGGRRRGGGGAEATGLGWADPTRPGTAKQAHLVLLGMSRHAGPNPARPNQPS